LDQLHKRDKKHYGSLSQEELFEHITKTFQDIDFTFYQSNYEGDVIEVLHESEAYDGIILNLGAWTHYSYAIRDALEMTAIPSCDVHLSDISQREPFRQINVLEGITRQTFFGEKEKSYERAITFLLTLLR
jgi:3-dehydroquinate dehydratase-2